MTVVLVLLCAVALPEAPGGEVFLAGDAAERGRRYEAATALFMQCAEHSKALAPYALARAAGNHGRAGNVARAVSLYEQMLREHPEGPWVRMAHAQLGALYLDGGDRVSARRHLNAALDGLDPMPWFLDTLAWRRADNALQLPEHGAEGFAYFRNVAATTIYVTPRRDAARRLLNSGAQEDRMWAVYGFARAGNTREARETLSAESLSIRGINGESQPLLSLDNALADDDAGSGFPRTDALVGANSDSFWVRVWLMLTAREQAGLGRADRAEALGDLLARYFPEGRDAGDVYWWLSERYERAPDTAGADRMYRRLAERCPDHVRAPRSLYNLANRAREAGRFAEAYTLYDELGRAHPQGRFTAEGYYRCAAMAVRENNTEKEQQYLSRAVGVGFGHFYAHRALHRLRESLGIRPANARSLRIDGGRDDFIQPFPVKDAVATLPHPMTAYDDRRARLEFFGMQGLEEGEWEALELILTLPASLEKMWYPVIADAGFMHTLLQFVNARNWGVEDGLHTWDRHRIEYPLAYRVKMARISDELGIDPYLLMAIARQESTFRAGVVSSAGATGVLQLMPATARWLGDVDARITTVHTSHLKSPENSIRLGAVYTERMLRRSQNNMVYALASYNAGPGNCDKWRARFPNYTLEEFVEAIPFSETNDYVKKVLGNYAAYHSIYPEKP